jgi:para-nitrobenzyl esterase
MLLLKAAYNPDKSMRVDVNCGSANGARRWMLWNQSRLGAFEAVPKITYLFFAGWVLTFGMVAESVGSAPIAKTLKKDDLKGVKMSDKPFVESQSGLFEGLWASDQKSVRVFKGIPYAEPPIGDLRFRPPVPKAPIKTRFLAQNDASPCWQSQGNDVFVWSLGSFPRSEDCLHLNIWAPTSAGPENPMPVMVWFHGGAHNRSWAHHPLFDGTSFAEQEVILVSVNYRLGPWGFLALPMLSEESEQGASGNYGLLDKIEALRWVQRSIAAFGGDVHNVTIFGQSAGSQSTCALMASPLADGLFHKAIGQSASCLDQFDVDPQGFETGSALLSELGNPKDVTALREVSNQALLDAATKSRWGARSRITVDGWVLPDAPLRRFQNQENNSVPLMVGSLANEGHLLIPLITETDAPGFRQFLARRFGRDPSAIAEIEAAYHSEIKEGYASARHAIETDLFMALSMRHWAALNAQSGAPSYVYFMSHVPPACQIYRPDAPELILDDGPRSAGAYHSGDLAFVFNTMDRTGCGWSDDDRALATKMQQCWTTFAKTGNPGQEGMQDWPAWSDTREVMVFDVPTKLSKDVRHQKLLSLARGLGLDPALIN